jgi:predicted alpha/beta superfamily hydrolase
MFRKALVSLSFSLVSAIVFSQHTIQFVISSLPVKNPGGRDLFIAGSFNGWNPQDNNYRFKKSENARLDDSVGQGNYFLGIKLEDGNYEFKITRGGWDKVECKKGGADIQNRFLKLTSDTTINMTVEEWTDNIEKKPKISTASKNVHVVDTAFLIPQLNRTRRVLIYLPQDYATSKKRYPVLYMHDGQNVFDNLTSFAGEWNVDETLDSIGNHRKEMIVVAIDHGGSKRINEYCPYDMEKFGEGEGDKYVDFLVKTLKPFVDKNYRTLKSKKNTFIAGSSMGGLISMYAVLKYPGVFGGAGIFSPAFSVGPKIFDDMKARGGKVNSKIYFYCGEQEGENMVPYTEMAFSEMRKVSNSRMVCLIRSDGKHSESVWKEEFPLFYLWLMER